MTLRRCSAPVRRTGRTRSPGKSEKLAGNRVAQRVHFRHGTRRILGGRGQQDFEHERADLHHIAVLQVALGGDEISVHQGTVRASQIAQRKPLVANAQQAVLTADHGTVGADVALRPTAEDELPAMEGEKMALLLAKDHFQLDIHASFRGREERL